MNRGILGQILNQTPTAPLFHYTDQNGFMGIIESTNIWATHTQYLNDWREYSHAVDMVRNQIQARLAFDDPALRPILKDMEQGLDGIESMNVCVSSFSEVRDSLSQWRAYGGRSSGFSIGFEGTFLKELADQHHWYLAPCIYDPKDQSEVVSTLVQVVIEENLAQDQKEISRPGGNLNAYLHRFAPILKDDAFKDEKEWRLISRPLSCKSEQFSFRAGSSMLIPYYKLPLHNSNGVLKLHEVVIGPTPHPNQSMLATRSFLVKNSHPSVPVALSNAPFRNW